MSTLSPDNAPNGSRLGPIARVRRRALGPAFSWAGLLVSAAFAYLAVRHVHFGDVWQGLRTSNLWWLVPAFALLVVTVLFKAARWRYLFDRETRPGMKPAVIALLIGSFFNNVLPARAGEAARVLAIRQRAGTSAAEATATIVVERAYDVVTLLLLLFVAVPWLPHVPWIHAAVLLAIVVATGLLAAIVIIIAYGVRPIHFVLRPLAHLPFLTSEGVEHVGENLSRGLAALRRPKLMIGALVWTTLCWLAMAASTWFVMRGFHLGLSIVAALLLVIATNLAQILPSSPSAIGVFEAAALVALGAYGIPESTALSCALVIHVLNFLPFIAIGLFLLRDSMRTRGAAQVQAAIASDR